MSIQKIVWETIIGLEIHIQLSTATKAFCADDARFSTEPNTQTGIVSLAHPGTLPKLNKKQIEYAVRLGLAMNSEINKASYFERKQYFYPDLPKGYQISQQASPICIGGYININTSNGEKKIRLHHIHMEEDAGKSVHDTDPTWSKIDLNRAGVPLLEMVTEPDFRTAEEVSVFLNELQRLVRFLDISDANMEEGSMRCDVNISVRPAGTDELRERCEVKNVNSRRFARKAIEFEVNRQIKKWESGERVVRQTMQFVPEEGITTPIREKESAHDYRYYPDPDLPPIILSREYIDNIKSTLPALPQELYQDLTKNKNLADADAQVLVQDKETVAFYYELIKGREELTKTAANWMIQTMLPYLAEKNMTFQSLVNKKASIVSLLHHLVNQSITSQQAKEIWQEHSTDESKTIETLIAAKMNTASTIDYTIILNELFNAFPEETKEFKGGKKKLLGFFLGEAKKKYPQINVKEIQKLLN